jgi:hypothetical protein
MHSPKAALKKVPVIASLFLALFLAGCRHGEEYWNIGGDEAPPNFDESLPAGSLVFAHPVMALDDIENIIPLGNLNPPGHTLPTDHIYFVTKGIGKEVVAPASGKILEITKGSANNDDAVKIAVSKTMTYYLGHIYLDEALAEGDEVSGGQKLGLSGGAAAVDLGVMNREIANPLINQHHPANTLYGDAPLKYYGDSALRESLYALVRPIDDPEYSAPSQAAKDGVFVFDQPGKLIGDWFRDGTLAYEWEEQLSFSYACFYPDQLRIAIGRENATQCMLFAVKSADPAPTRPEDVTVASGAAAYQLYNGNVVSKGAPTGPRVGLMMVQMLTDDTLRIEIFNDAISPTRAFTDAACNYER